MPRLYLIRHAEAAPGLLLGQSDPPLSDKGRAQAASLRLPLETPVYVSPLRRAIETAEIAGVRFEVAGEFKEVSYGEWDGLSWNEIESRWPELAKQKLADWIHVTPPGGEPWVDFQRRVLEGLERIEKPAVIISHIAVHAVVAQRLKGEDPLRFEQHHTEILEYEY